MMFFTEQGGSSMQIANVEYGAPQANAGARPMGVRVFAEGGFERRRIAEDCDAAGLTVLGHGEFADLLDRAGGGISGRLGDVIVIDCPRPDIALLAALAQLDVIAARAGAKLVVSTDLNYLDDVFACLDQCEAHILVRPSRAERLAVLSQLRHKAPRACVREMSEEDRQAIRQLSEQIARISHTIDGADGGAWGAFPLSAFGFSAGDAPTGAAAAAVAEAPRGRGRAGRPPLPDPRLVRLIIKNRQKRWEPFGTELFADPAWDMLLDLTAARAEHRRVSVTSLCIASGVPATTALRWIGQLVEAGWFERVQDDGDKRRAFIALTDRAADAMAHYFAKLDAPAALTL
jgi:hypothetical protein